jgi:hypothetical protein
MANPVTESVRKRRNARLKARMDALRKTLATAPEAQGLRVLLSSPAGAALLAYLEREFLFGELMGEDAYETAFNLGAREAVQVLRALRDRTERTGDDDHA